MEKKKEKKKTMGVSGYRLWEGCLHLRCRFLVVFLVVLRVLGDQVLTGDASGIKGEI